MWFTKIWKQILPAEKQITFIFLMMIKVLYLGKIIFPEYYIIVSLSNRFTDPQKLDSYFFIWQLNTEQF